MNENKMGNHLQIIVNKTQIDGCGFEIQYTAKAA